MSSYYNRRTIILTNGNTTFRTDDDAANERDVAAQIESSWSCRCVPFSLYNGVDWWFERRGSLVGVGELKSRSHSISKYDTVFLNLRKLAALKAAAVDYEAPAIFLVKWTDAIRWINIIDVDESAVRMGGCKQYVKSHHDQEMVIDVPVMMMRMLDSGNPLLTT